MNTKEILKNLSNGQALNEEQAFKVFEAMMGEEEISDTQIAAFLSLMAARDITADELVGGARSLRGHMVQANFRKALPGVEFLDTCGTGGSGLNSFNTSTTAAFILAAAEQHVAKHGNRAATSQSGSADLLKALGINIEADVPKLLNCIFKTRFAFLFAPRHHPATKRVVMIRKELGFRTIFNFLGPLSNPAGAVYQVLGVSSKAMLLVIAEALGRLGTKRALVVCGEDGLDEITLTGQTYVAEVDDRGVKTYTIKPEDFGLSSVSFSEIEGMTPELTAKKVKEIFSGEKSAYRDLVCLNAGASFYACGKVDNITEGVKQAQQTIDSGEALRTLEQVVQVTNQ